MRLSLREEDTIEYLSFYKEYLEEVQQLNKNVTDEFNKVMQESKYDRLQHKISVIIDAYMEAVMGNIENGLFSNWTESDSSLRACLRTYRAGESADEVCAQVEVNMGNLMQDILKIEKADVIITERPIVSEEGLEHLEDVCRNAQSEIENIKSEYLLQIDNKKDENEIFGTLAPLFKGVSSKLELFFETSLNSFIEFHEFVSGISTRLHNITHDNVDGDVTGGGIDKKIANSMAGIAMTMGDSSEASSIDKFKEITLLIYQSICGDLSAKRKISYETISAIMPVYHKFYAEYGEILKDKFNSLEEREEFIKCEYITVIRERGNEKFFEGDEIWTFYSHAYHTYMVFDRVADMLRNIADKCRAGKATDMNLMYGAYVLFTPIINGYIAPENGKKYSKFSRWASQEILQILGTESKKNNEEQKVDGNIVFEGEKFSDENIKLFVVVVERIVNQVGVDELNSSVEKHYTTLKNSRTMYSKKVGKRITSKHNIDLNTYGRYTVTRKSIQVMAPVCNQKNSILEPIDKFYKEKFESLGRSFEKANTAIHAISSFCGLWGLGTWNLSKMFSKSDSDSSILEKVQLGGISLASCTTAGKIINGGAHMLKIMDWAMPYLKKSKLLVRLNEKVWNLTRQDIQIPYIQKMMDQYMMEHHELKYGMNKGQSPYFQLYHSVATTIDDNHQRRAFENSIFAAEELMTSYIIKETDAQKNRAIWCGVFLNLVRSGMCSKQDIESGTANEIVDKLYNVYVSKDNVTPRVDINPDNKVLT